MTLNEQQAARIRNFHIECPITLSTVPLARACFAESQRLWGEISFGLLQKETESYLAQKNSAQETGAQNLALSIMEP